MGDDKIMPFTSDDVDAAVTALANNAYLGEEGPLGRDDLVEIVRIVLSNASARGRLLPPEGEVSTIWGLRRGNWVEHVGYGSGSELLARQAAADGHGEMVRQDTRTWPDESQYISPWEVVSDGGEKGADDGHR